MMTDKIERDIKLFLWRVKQDFIKQANLQGVQVLTLIIQCQDQNPTTPQFERDIKLEGI
jgi:hypothetical protein